MCDVRQGPTNWIRVGLPRSGSRDKGPIGRWAYWWRSTNTEAHNAEADLGLHGFRLGLTPFADLTLEEFRGRVLGFQQSRRNDTTADDATDGRSTRFDLNSAGEPQPVPAAVDWRKSGAVTTVRNPVACGP